MRVVISATLLLSSLILSLARPANAADWLYTIRPGDNLWTLCKLYSIKENCWIDLASLNNIDRTRQIPPGTVIRFPVSWLKKPPVAVVIDFSHGDVFYQLPGEEKHRALAGVKLPIGSELTTGNGRVKVSFADGSSMILAPNSHLQLDTLSSFESTGMVDSAVRLSRGSVKTRVVKREPKSRFRTITPSAVAAVRGTEYRVSSINHETNNSEKITTIVEVYNGLVDVNAENTTRSVSGGYGVITMHGHAPLEPVPLLEKPVFLPLEEHQFLPATIQWQVVNLAAGYQLDIYSNQGIDDQTEILVEQRMTNETSLTINNLTLGCYRLNLRGIDNSGLQGLPASKRLCLKRRIDTPALEDATINRIENNRVKITWPEATGADRYRIQIAEDPDFKLIRDTIEASDASYSFDESGVIFIRVQALGEEGEHSPFSPSLRWEPEKNHWLALIPVGLFLLALL